MAIEEGDNESKKEEKQRYSDKEKDRESEKVEVDQGKPTPIRQTENPGTITGPCKGINEERNIEKPFKKPRTQDDEVFPPINKELEMIPKDSQELT